MKRKALFFAVIASGVLLAQTPSRPQFSDKKQRFALWFTEFSMEYPDKETTVFDISGNPVHGYSRDQNLEFSSRAMTGTLSGSKSGDMRLRTGTATGNAIVTVSNAKGTSVFKSAKVTIDNNAETATIGVPGSFTFTNGGTGATGTRTMVLKGTKGTFKLKSLDLKSEDPLLSADVAGPVTMTFDEVGASLSQKSFELTAQSLSERTEGTDKVFHVTGNVHISGDVTGKDNFVGDMYVSQATIVVDKDLTIKSIKTKAPGSGSLAEKKDGS